MAKEHVGERPEIGDVEMLGAQRLDHAVIVGGDEALDLHAGILLDRVEDVLALGQHRPGILGRDQADLQHLLRLCRTAEQEGTCGEKPEIATRHPGHCCFLLVLLFFD